MRKEKNSILVVVGCGALLAGLLACGSAGGGQAPAGGGATTAEPATEVSVADPLDSMDPCSVVPQADVSALFGKPSDAGTPGSKGSPTFCLYAAPDQSAHLSVNMSYTASGALTSDDYKQFSAGSPVVPGLGDGAFYIPGGQGLQGDILYVAKGPWLIHISGGNATSPYSADQLKPIAQSALSHLP